MWRGGNTLEGKARRNLRRKEGKGSLVRTEGRSNTVGVRKGVHRCVRKRNQSKVKRKMGKVQGRNAGIMGRLRH